MNDAKYTHDLDAFDKLVLCAPFMVEEMRRRAQLVGEAAVSIAPIGDPETDPHPGLYKDSFLVSAEIVVGGRSTRARGRVANTAPYAAAVEARHHTLRKALLAADG